MKLALQIAAGIVIATLTLWGLSLLMVGAAANHVGGEVTKMVEQQSARVAERAERERARQHEAALDRREAEASAAEAEHQHALELAAVAERRAAKERAWLAHYRQPAECEQPPSWEVQVRCGNRYMRAKAEFERRWDPTLNTRPAGAPAGTGAPVLHQPTDPPPESRSRSG